MKFVNFKSYVSVITSMGLKESSWNSGLGFEPTRISSIPFLSYLQSIKSPFDNDFRKYF